MPRLVSNTKYLRHSRKSASQSDQLRPLQSTKATMATRTVARSCLNPPSSFLHSAAASFLQLTPRRCFQSSNAPILDFLAPRLQPVHTRQRQRLQSKQNHGAYANQSIKGQRSFSSTNRKLDTKAIVNASKDDDGNDMLLDITPRAAKV